MPESDVGSDERVGLPQRSPAPEVKKCKADRAPSVNKASAGLQVPRGSSNVTGPAAKPEGATPVSEADADPAAKAGPCLANAAAIGQGNKCMASLASDDSKPEVSTGNSFANGLAAELEVLKGVPAANKVATDPEVTERVSLENKATTLLGVKSTAPEVTEVPSLMNESGAKLEVTRRTSSVDEASTELELRQIVSPVDKLVTDQGDIITTPGVTGTDFTSTEGSVQPEVTSGPSVMPSQCDAGEAGGSLNSTTNGPVRAKGPAVEGGVAKDRSVTPSVSFALDIVARSIGTSGRTDVICYARRRGKRKLELLEVKTEDIELKDGVMCEETLERTGRYESALSTAGSTDVKLADIKKKLSSAAGKVKKVKRNRFECTIDYCRMTFKTKAELSVHKKNMCTVKSCSRHFRSHRYLRRHQSVHSDDMPYKCPWDGCNMAFKWSWDRAEHFKVHAGVKPYKCTTPGCNRIYKFVSDFTRHRRRCKPQR